MELFEILKILRRWLWLIISIVLVTTLVLTAWSSSAQSVYEAQVKLQMSAPQQEDVAAYDQYRAISLRDEITIARNNFIEIVQDSEVHDTMIDQLNLDEDLTTYELEVKPERDTDYIDVVVQARTPQLAALIANTLVDEAITYSGELRAKPTNAEKELFSNQLVAAEEEFRAAENAFTEFKAHNGIASLEGEIAISQTLLEQLKLARDQRVLDNEPYQNDLINQIDGMITQHQVELDRLLSIQPMYSLLEANALQLREEYRQILNQQVSVYTKAAAEEEYLVAEDAFTEFKSENGVTSLQAEIAITQRLLEQLHLERDQRILDEPTLTTIDALIAERQLELDRLVILQPIYNLLSENAEKARAKYQHILDKYTEAELKAIVVQAANFIQVVRPAQEPEEPANNPKIFLFLGISGSLGLGILLAFFIEYITGANRDTQIIDEIDSHMVMGLQVLGSVPIMSNGLYTQDNPDAEAIRHLRTTILLASPNNTMKTIQITSPQPGDGKTFISANLGAVLAGSRSRVVLVDTDFRKPCLHESFDLPNPKGLANILEPEDTSQPPLVLLNNQVKETNIPGLSLLSAGTPPKDPSLLLTSTNLPLIFEELSRQFDYVLVDTPPMLTAPDASILASLLDGIIVVLDPKASTRMVREAIDVFCSRDDLPILGVVLNRTSSDLYGYGYYRYRDYPTRSWSIRTLLFGKNRKSPTPNLISEAQASDILGVRVSTIRRWRQEGRLPVIKRGLGWWIREDELRTQFGIQVQEDAQILSQSVESSDVELDQHPQPDREAIVAQSDPVESPAWKLSSFSALVVKKVEECIKKIQHSAGNNHQSGSLDSDIPDEMIMDVETGAPISIDLTAEADSHEEAESLSIAETILDEDLEGDDEVIDSLENSPKIPGVEDEEETDMVSVDQAAKALGVHANTIRLWCREGRIHGVKRNRRWLISEESVKETEVSAQEENA